MINNYKPLIFFIFFPLIVGVASYRWGSFYLHQFSFSYTIYNIILLLLIAPILEEIVFRGLLQDIILNYIPKRWCALWGLNLIFGLFHYHINPMPLYLCAVFISGLIFSYAKVLYLNLVYPLGLHIYYNLIYLFLLRFMSEQTHITHITGLSAHMCIC